MPTFPPDLGDTFLPNPEQAFTGRSFQQAWILPTKDQALAFAKDIISGGYDPFLRDAASSIRITRNRDFEGHYAPGWAVVMSANAPAPGQNSGGGGAAPAGGQDVDLTMGGTTFTGNPVETPGGSGRA